MGRESWVEVVMRSGHNHNATALQQQLGPESWGGVVMRSEHDHNATALQQQ